MSNNTKKDIAREDLTGNPKLRPVFAFLFEHLLLGYFVFFFIGWNATVEKSIIILLGRKFK